MSTSGLKLKTMLSVVVLLTILFPYVQVLPLATDTQPNFLISFLILSPVLITIRFGQLLFVLTIITVLLLYTLGDLNFASIRSWPAYLTPPLVFILVRSMCRSEANRQMIDRWIDRAFWLWVGFGLLQFLAGSSLIEVTYRASTTEDRGWMSFAPEPTAFSTMLFLFAAYYAAHWRIRMVIVAFLATMVFSQSALGLIYFVLLGLCYFVIRVRNPLIWLAIATVIFFFTIIIDIEAMLQLLPPDLRLTRLIELAVLNSNLLLYDMSIASRLGDLELARDMLLEGPILGNGFGSEFRIKSGWGMIVYEMGLLGFLFASGWIAFMLFKAMVSGRRVLASTLAIVIMLFSATPLAMPFVSFVIALLIYDPPLPDRRKATSGQRTRLPLRREPPMPARAPK